MRTVFSIIQTLIGIIIYLPHILIFISQPTVTKRFIISDLYAKETGNSHDTFSINTLKPSVLILLSRYLLTDSYFQALFFYRLRKCKLRHILYHRHFSLEIPLDTEIGYGLKYDHPFSTILNAKRIGNYCRIKNNITIGNKNDDESLRPVLEDNVYIGAGAIIIGRITIGARSIIGAGAVVTKSVPQNSVVVGNPARLIS